MGTGFLEQPQMQGAEVDLAWYFYSQSLQVMSRLQTEL